MLTPKSTFTIHCLSKEYLLLKHNFTFWAWSDYNIHLYISYKLLYVQYFDSGDHQMICTIIISLLIEKLFYLLRSQSFSFQIVSKFIDTFVKFFNFMSQEWGF